VCFVFPRRLRERTLYAQLEDPRVEGGPLHKLRLRFSFSKNSGRPVGRCTKHTFCGLRSLPWRWVVQSFVCCWWLLKVSEWQYCPRNVSCRLLFGLDYVFARPNGHCRLGRLAQGGMSRVCCLSLRGAVGPLQVVDTHFLWDAGERIFLDVLCHLDYRETGCFCLVLGVLSIWTGGVSMESPAFRPVGICSSASKYPVEYFVFPVQTACTSWWRRGRICFSHYSCGAVIEFRALHSSSESPCIPSLHGTEIVGPKEMMMVLDISWRDLRPIDFGFLVVSCG